MRDTKADGHSAAVEWQNLSNNVFRWGACVNSHGSGTWAVCNKNYTEGSPLGFRAGLWEGGFIQYSSKVSTAA
ncbi:MAG: hypothetical protein HKP61_10560 [Dactylosporangium sp.]|nr:hypothetical protein [Dactylosporangium sp.]NNJ61371.1 hypothetical protein [Dactylosporangium sp.]